MTQYPKSSYEMVGGLVFLPRLTDKLRLHAAGKLPEDYNLGGGLDSRFCRFLGVNYEYVAARVRAGDDDATVLEWCYTNGRRPSAEEVEWFNGYMMKRGWRDQASAKLAESKAKRGIADRDDVQTGFDLQDYDEGREVGSVRAAMGG